MLGVDAADDQLDAPPVQEPADGVEHLRSGVVYPRDEPQVEDEELDGPLGELVIGDQRADPIFHANDGAEEEVP